MSPVFCSFLFYYKRDLVYPFYTEVGKMSEEGVFQTLQEQFQITRVNEGAWRLANYMLHVYRPDLKFTEVNS